MNEQIWHKNFKDWINADEAIYTLYQNDALTDWNEAINLRCKLLDEIIEIFKSEVAEDD